MEKRKWAKNMANGLFWWNACKSNFLERELRMLTAETFKFLREALSQVKPEMPFRGPSRYEADGWSNWRYEYRLHYGNIGRFRGDESISKKSPGEKREKVFSQDFIGGLVVPR